MSKFEGASWWFFHLFLPGESGSYLYVAAEGEYDVIKDGKTLGRWERGRRVGGEIWNE